MSDILIGQQKYIELTHVESENRGKVLRFFLM
jgi:hypothetical protein